MSLLISRSLSSPLVPGLSLLQDDAMMGDMMGDMMEGAGAAMDMSDMTAMGEQNTNVLIFWIKKLC